MKFALKETVMIEMAQAMHKQGIAVEINNGNSVELVSEE